MEQYLVDTNVANGYTLITNNEKDFAHIRGLKILNPYKGV